MRVRTDGTKCEFCDKNLDGEALEETHTKKGHDYCSYECLEAAYSDDVPEGEDFLTAK